MITKVLCMSRFRTFNTCIKDRGARKRYETPSPPLPSQLAYETADPCKQYRTSSLLRSHELGRWGTEGDAVLFKQAGKLPLGTSIWITELSM